MKKQMTTLILLLGTFLSQAQKEARLCFQFDDKSQIEKVETRFSMPGQEITHIFVPGQEIEKRKWIFTIPDTVFQKYWALKLLVSRREGDTLVQGETEIKVPGKEPDLFISNVFYFSKDSVVFLNLKTDSVAYDSSGKFRGILFLLTNPEQTATLNAQLNTRYYNIMGKSRELLAYFSEMLKKYPGSEVVGRWALDVLYSMKYNLSVDELQGITALLSEKDKQSYLGKKYQAYLEAKRNFNYNHFPNLVLPENFTESPEHVIRDTSRYNLVIFSHSACIHCHAMIPLLKEIYGDLKNQLEITYISVDDNRFVKNWETNVIQKYAIPWRSLLSANDPDQVSDTYQIRSFPTAYLVHPGGKFEEIDVRKKTDKEKLYRLVRGSQQ